MALVTAMVQMSLGSPLQQTAWGIRDGDIERKTSPEAGTCFVCARGRADEWSGKCQGGGACRLSHGLSMSSGRTARRESKARPRGDLSAENRFSSREAVSQD